MKEFVFINAKIVTSAEIFEGYVVVRDGKIAEVGRGVYKGGADGGSAGAVSAKYLELPFNAQNKLGKIATGGSLSTLQTWMMAEAYLPMEQLKESSLGTSKGNHGNKVSLR